MLESHFPNLKAAGYRIESPQDPRYNCVAWAAGESTVFAWWWPVGAGYWPATAPREETIEAFATAFATVGYRPCDMDVSLEDDFEKIAIYAIAGKPKHAARQLRNGRWTSKLGREWDIEHALDGLEGATYGRVVLVLRRPRPILIAGRPVRSVDLRNLD